MDLCKHTARQLHREPIRADTMLLDTVRDDVNFQITGLDHLAQKESLAITLVRIGVFAPVDGKGLTFSILVKDGKTDGMLTECRYADGACALVLAGPNSSVLVVSLGLRSATLAETASFKV
jgi:hypothetical protein